MDKFGFEYLSVIKKCMDKVYEESPNLIAQRNREIGYELSISFRLGYYLSDALKGKTAISLIMNILMIAIQKMI